MLIKEIKMSNLLSYGKEITVELRPLNIIIGPNASGKSNLIEVIDLFRNAPIEITRPIRDGGGVSDWIWKGSAGDTAAKIDAVFNYKSYSAQNLRYALSFSSFNGRFNLCDERIENEKTVDAKQPYPYFFYHFNNGKPCLNLKNKKGEVRKRNIQREDIDFERSILAQRKDIDSYPEITWLGEQFQKIAIYRNWAFGRYTAPRLPQKADMPNAHLASDCSNLSLVLSKLFLDSSTKKKILDCINCISDGISDIVFQIEGGTSQIFIQESGMSIPATRISDGTLRFLCLLAVLCDSNPPPLICIEEPELGLHPDVLPTLAELLKNATEKTQIIITTHSPQLVDEFSDSPDDVLVAEKEEGATVMQRLSKKELGEWLEKYRLGSLWLQGEIGGVRW